jgi:hypothetical protein
MYAICEEMQPITGRGVGYKLFTAGKIPSMSIIKNASGTKTDPMKRVYRLLKEAREEEIIPWPWIVEEGRSLEIKPSWSNPEQFLKSAVRQYRRDLWDQQPERVEVWSEKGTVRGVLAPVLNQYGVGFRVMRGFTSATTVRDVAKDYDGRDLNVIYVGDYDPSGLYMSEVDLPRRLAEYGGDHVFLYRAALLREDCDGLPSFPVSSKKKDPRYRWWTDRCYGADCWELDAMNPNDLRDVVEVEIKRWIEPEEWERCAAIHDAEVASLMNVPKMYAKRART